MLVKLFIIVLILVGLSLVALSIGILLKRGFPETHIGRNRRIKEKGIHCANTTDANERRDYKPIEIQEEEEEEEEK